MSSAAWDHHFLPRCSPCPGRLPSGYAGVSATRDGGGQAACRAIPLRVPLLLPGSKVVLFPTRLGNECWGRDKSYKYHIPAEGSPGPPATAGLTSPPGAPSPVLEEDLIGQRSQSFAMVQSAMALEGEVRKRGWTDTPNTSDHIIRGSSKLEPALWGSLMHSSQVGEGDAVAVAPARCMEGSPRAKVRRTRSRSREEASFSGGHAPEPITSRGWGWGAGSCSPPGLTPARHQGVCGFPLSSEARVRASLRPQGRPRSPAGLRPGPALPAPHASQLCFNPGPQEGVVGPERQNGVKEARAGLSVGR